jgi:hypothetical protein
MKGGQVLVGSVVFVKACGGVDPIDLSGDTLAEEITACHVVHARTLSRLCR